MPKGPMSDRSTSKEVPTPSKSSSATKDIADEATPLAKGDAETATTGTAGVAGAGEGATAKVIGAGQRILEAVGTGAERFGDILTGKWERAMSRVRPWREFLDVSLFCGCASLKEVPERIVKNVKYFRFNYLVIWVAMVALSVLTRPLSLLGCLLLIGLWVVLFGFYTEDTSLTGSSVFSDEAKVGLLCVVGFFVFWFAHAIKMFLSAAIVTIVISLAHAGVRKPSSEEPEPPPVVV